MSTLPCVLVLVVLLAGCKPTTEPEYPYERQPLQLVSTVSAESIETLASQAVERELEGTSVETPEAPVKTSGVPTDGDDSQEQPTELVEAEPVVEEIKWPLETFHEARGKVIQNLDDTGRHEYQFHPSGFFNYQFSGTNQEKVKRRGTYQLEGDSLHLRFTETRLKNATEMQNDGIEVLRGQSRQLAVQLPGDGSLHLDSIRYLAVR